MKLAFALVAVAACSGKGAQSPRAEAMPMMDQKIEASMHMPMDDAAKFAPLDIGADWATWTKLDSSPVSSPTHGGRLVDTYVNAIGLAAYKDDSAALPVGTVIVKTSMEVADGHATGVAGPIFVMEKRAPGFDPEHGDWYYAIHWAEPPAPWKAKLGGPIYWRTPSHRVAYCVDCHDNYDRNLGGIPADHRAW